MIETILRIWSRVETVLIGLLIVAALTVFLTGAGLRVFAPAHAVDWAEEVAIYCIVWATVLSGSVLTAEGRHISADVFVAMLPPAVQQRLRLAVFVLVFGFCAAMFWFGWQAVEFTLMLNERSASSLRVKQGWALFLALPVGMGLILLRLALMALAGRFAVSESPDRPGAAE